MFPLNALLEPGKYSLSTAKPLVLSDSGVENSPENAVPIAPAIALTPNRMMIHAAITTFPRRKAQRAKEAYIFDDNNFLLGGATMVALHI